MAKSCKGLFSADIEEIDPNRVVRYSLRHETAPVSFGEALKRWQLDAEFRNYFTQLLCSSAFEAFRWETPVLTKNSMNQPFQFVLLNAPGFVSRRTNRDAFTGYFTNDDTIDGVVSFTNLGGDATLVVPSPRTDDIAYGHLAAFLRRGPSSQIDSLWRVVGKEVETRIGPDPLWLSTAGGGVAWLHVRLDRRPKYYGHGPYRNML
ncbi:MAG: hypothetical protein R3C03_20095 [Pirellulaceae bacterium]